MMTAPSDLAQLRHKRSWSKGEKRVLTVLLSGSRLMTQERIGAVARVQNRTAYIVLDTLAAHELLSQTQLGHYWLTDMGRSFCMEVVGLA